jgi:hypothetical protein
LSEAVVAAVAEATGQTHRANPVRPRTGGPAGNAVLTAWIGLVLLLGSLGELLTLVSIHNLISWHVAIGAVLVPPAVLKTGSTGWRMVRYYLGNRPYEEAGPPPTPLRLLGPLVVVSTLGLLATGVWLVVLGPESSHRSVFSLVGFRVDWVTLHQAFFAVWCVVTGLHLLGRLVPALWVTVGPARSAHVPGAWARWLLLAGTAASSAALAVALVRADGAWASFHH